MHYFKIKKQYDQKNIISFYPYSQLKRNRVLVMDELITATEATNEGIFDELKKYSNIVKICKNNTFKIHGYRFESKGYPTL